MGQTRKSRSQVLRVCSLSIQVDSADKQTLSHPHCPDTERHFNAADMGFRVSKATGTSTEQSVRKTLF
ncbi:hypothetical protein JZ751_004792 [Albula glossodonta]|uniref:Uncharacterized protein n=1 Tax=Albula glossodonta TaxID=121402 RepID=A0A8T2P3T6_9TELE|nr:hypothetical protein JZ751_004792 [Albula glossodonta]